MEKLFQDSTMIKLKEQEVSKTISVNAIKEVQTKFGKTFLCYNLKHNSCFFANSQLNGYLKKIVPNLQCDNGIYIRNDALIDIVKFSIESIIDNKVNLKFIRNNFKKISNDADSDKEQTVKYHKISTEINIDEN